MGASARLPGDVEGGAAAAHLQHRLGLAPRVGRRVVLLGKMGEHQVAQARMEHLRYQLRGLRIGEVPQVRAHAPLQGRRVGAFEEKSRVVVRLQHESVEIAQCESKRPRRRTEIGDDGGADATPSLDALFERVRDRLDRVVGHRNGADVEPAPEEQHAVPREWKAQLGGRRIAQRMERAARRVHASAQLARERRRAEAVVGVLVSEQDVGHFAQIEPRVRAAPPGLAVREAGVDQHARSARLDEGRVAAAPACEHAEAH